MNKLEEQGYKGEHYCWMKPCSCGTYNWGCIKVGVICKSCQKPIDFPEYSKLGPTLSFVLSEILGAYKPSFAKLSNSGIDFKEDYQI